MGNNSEILLYQTEDGQTKIDVRLEEETVWLSQAQMRELFQKERSVISKHIKNIFKEGELQEELVCANFAHTTQHDALKGKTQVKNIILYNLDVVISVGYRVKSHQGTKFRQWATPYPFATDLWASPTWQGIYRREEPNYGMRSVEAYLQRPEFELYDMENDPHEINNLSGNPEYRSTLDSMILKIKNFQLQTRDPWLIMWENESVFQGTGVNLYCEIQV